MSACTDIDEWIDTLVNIRLAGKWMTSDPAVILLSEPHLILRDAMLSTASYP